MKELIPTSGGKEGQFINEVTQVEGKGVFDFVTVSLKM